ncbi:sugar kinase [Agromyces larvae]|uniref:Sugar kinase n=1 Tax=Agromyces larvae TaxID=2929802 RepID=A0ABY4C503_9MICO|nr:sugar kinase [Agromyces larvae]UOE45073.1 sugar kinase [Agromyces larvae]
MEVLTLGEALVCFSRPTDPADAARGLFTRSIGGAEANTAIGLARLGNDVWWASCLGRDPLGDHVLDVLAAEGVGTSLVARSDTRPTAVMVKERTTPHDTAVTYYRRDAAGTELAPGDLPAGVVESAGHVHLTGVALAIGAGPRALAHETARRAAGSGVTVSFDPNFRPSIISEPDAVREYRRMLASATQLLCNETEARLITGRTDLDSAIDELAGLGPSTIIVKRGADGALAWHEGERLVVPAHPAPHPVDPVGAGDAFNAGWIHARLAGLALEDALALAAFVAAQVVQHPGDYEGFPNAGEVEAWQAARSAEHAGRSIRTA